MIRFKYDILFGLIEWRIEEPKRASKNANIKAFRPKDKIVSMSAFNRIFKTQHKFHGRKPRSTTGDESLS